MRKTRRRSPKSWLKICFPVILMLFLLFGAGKLVKPIKEAVWDGRHQFNLVINSSPIVLASFTPASEKSLNILIIPEGTFIDTIHGYGSYRIESIFNLGQLDNQGGELLTGSIQEYFGLPADGFISAENLEAKIDKSENFKEFIQKSLSILFKGRGETNLKKWDLIRLWWLTRNILRNKIKVVDLGQTSTTLEVILADGTKVQKIDLEKIDGVISELFADQKIVEDDLSLAVLNGTSSPGLAQRAARLITNIGGRVLEVGSLADKRTKCEIKSRKTLLKSYTLQKLMKVFSCRWAGEDLGDHRAEVILILGEDYWEKLSKRRVSFGI